MTRADKRYLSAAEGWLELGDWREANVELENIDAALRAHPDVLQIRCQIYAKAGKWTECVDIASALVTSVPSRSFGWVHRSFALHELERTEEAFGMLLPAAQQFPDEWYIPYNLACYCAQLGRVDESREWFKKSMAIDEHAAKQAAVDDPDLKPLWDSMASSSWERS